MSFARKTSLKPSGALVGLALSVMLSSLGTSIANVGLPELARAFGVPFQDVQWVVLTYLLAMTAVVVSVGRLGDLFGRLRLLAAGLAVFTIASVLCGCAPTFGALLAARALQGLGAATMMALGMALVAETVPRDRTGTVMGLLGTMSAVGTALGPVLGGLGMAWAGWRTLFWGPAPLGAIALVWVWRQIPASAPEVVSRDRRFDGLGTLILCVTLVCGALGVTSAGEHLGAGRLAWLGVAFLGAGLFVWTQARVRSPLVPWTALRHPVLGAGWVMNALVAVVMMATLVVGPFVLSRGLGLGPAVVGGVMSVGPVMSMLSGVPAGRAVDRWGASSMVATGLWTMATGALMLAMLPGAWGLPGYLLALAVLTPGYQLFLAANNAAVLGGASSDQRGVVSGLLSLARNLGLIAGASVMGSVFAAAVGAPDLVAATPESLLLGLRTTFGLAVVLLLGAWGLAVTVRRS